MKKTISVAAGIVCLGILSCSQSAEDMSNTPEHQKMAPAPDTAAYTVTDTTKYKFDFALANIPSPANSVQDMNNFGVPYDNMILSYPDNADKYSSEERKAMNLGIYNIDMAYAMINDRGQDVLNIMKAVMYLGDQLGIRNALGNMVGNRAEANLGKRDSLFKLLDEIFVKSDSYLRNNERVYTATVIFGGSWLESLYLTCKISDKVTEPAAKKKARRMLWEQRFHLGNLISVLNDYKKNPDAADLLKDLKEIHSQISAVKIDTDMDDDTYGSISAKIYKLRYKYTA